MVVVLSVVGAESKEEGESELGFIDLFDVLKNKKMIYKSTVG